MAYVRPFYNRLGGKSRSLKYILEVLPKKVKVYVEPFFGAGWVYFNYTGAEKYIVNDMDPEVYKMLRAIRDGDEARMLSYDWKKSESRFYHLKKIYKHRVSFLKQDHYFMLHAYRYLNYYGVLGDYETYNKSVPKKDTPPLDRYMVCSKRLQDNTVIKNEDYSKVLEKVEKDYHGKDVLYYIDPPHLGVPNKDRYRHNIINEYDFCYMACMLEGNVVISLPGSLGQEWIDMLINGGYQHQEIGLHYGSDNLQKYKQVKKVKRSKEHLFYKTYLEEK